MGLERNNAQGTLTCTGGVNLGDIPFSLTVTDQIIAKSDPALLVDIISSEVGRIVDGLMDSLPTREQLLDYVFEKVAGDFTEVYQLPIENPYREEVPPFNPDYDTSEKSPNLGTVAKILKEVYAPLWKEQMETEPLIFKYLEAHKELVGGVHPISKGPSPNITSQTAQSIINEIQGFKYDNHKVHVKAAQEFAAKNLETMGFVMPDEWVPPSVGTVFSGYAVVVKNTVPPNEIHVNPSTFKNMKETL